MNRSSNRSRERLSMTASVRFSMFITTLALCVLGTAGSASAQTQFQVDVFATQDAMIFGTSAGADTGNASGKGPGMFAGADGASNRKRSLVTFDLAAAGLPSTAVIDSVTMTLVVGQIAGSGMGGTGSNLPSRTIRVLHVTSDWSEGPSGSPTSASIGGTGQGAPILTGDTSWTYTNFNTVFWTTLGGDVDPTEIASTTLTTPFSVGQSCVWSSSAMATDVQNWLSTPAGYHGWMIQSDLETTPTSFLGWWTKDGAVANNNAALAPKLTIVYH